MAIRQVLHVRLGLERVMSDVKGFMKNLLIPRGKKLSVQAHFKARVLTVTLHVVLPCLQTTLPPVGGCGEKSNVILW